ncbi:MAG: RAMP superfamily CRISPR-associated protein [Acidobacteria bacterium]|nr:RAMP superfamily CRISPR-associated protein [Acidobacteriota bacterium]
MHKRLFNEAVVKLTIKPVGPILIKAGEGASDPTKPDMSFVRTTRGGSETVYLPGSSLKGVLRSHCERLARTVQNAGRSDLSCDPLGEKKCSKQFEDDKSLTGAQKHKQSCFICRLFGNTSLASHFQIADAYPQITDAHPLGEWRTEERNGVAIDRVFGSVVPGVGPFNYETVTSGEFLTTLHVRNFTLAQIGLLALALRDLAAERVRLGFAKSRGMGLVTARVDEFTMRYPGCELGEDEGLRLIGGGQLDRQRFYGISALLEKSSASGESDAEEKDAEAGRATGDEYGYPQPAQDHETLPPGYVYASDDWLEVELRAPRHEEGGADWQPLGRACVPKWKKWAEHVNRNN